MYMTLLEFILLGFYLALLLAAMVTIQMLESQRLQLRVEETAEKFVESGSFEEPSSDDEVPLQEAADPEKDEYSMTENPMFRHRTVHGNQEEVDMSAVD